MERKYINIFIKKKKFEILSNALNKGTEKVFHFNTEDVLRQMV